MTQSKCLAQTTPSPQTTQAKAKGDIIDRLMIFLFKRILLPLLWHTFLAWIAITVFFALVFHFYGQPQHGKTLSTFMQNVASENLEYSAAFTMDGKTIFETTSQQEDKVRTPATFLFVANLIGRGDYIFLHNHPNGDPRPSTYDLITYAQVRPTRAIIAGDGCQGIIEAPTGWPSEQDVRAYLESVTMQVESVSSNVSYCSSGNYIELFNYPELTRSFLQAFNLVYTEEIIA